MRYAIDIKPTQYTIIDTTDVIAQNLIDEYNSKYDTVLEYQYSKTYNDTDWDWRELIYRMAQDYFKYAHIFDDFEMRVRQANPNLFPTGITGYEQYYTDIISFWRQLYDPELQNKIEHKNNEKKLYDEIIDDLNKIRYDEIEVKEYVENKTTIDFLPENIPLIQDMIIYQDIVISNLDEINYQQIIEAKNYLTTLQLYLTDLKSKLNKYKDLSMAAEEVLNEYNSNLDKYYSIDGLHPYWNKSVYEAPEQLIFWFDFIGEGELQNFNVKTIGARPKVVNDTSVKAIYFRETPNVIFVTSEDEIGAESAFKYIQVTNIDNMLMVSDQGKSAKDKLDELIYAHGYCVENVTINSVPIYYLQPNTRVHLFDEKTGLNGDYIISKMTIPLTYNGTMSITASKAAENII